MPTIGEILQEARKKKGVSQEAAARAVKLKLDRLRDLEDDRYDDFAAHVYVRSFMRQYAEYLGLDSAPLIQKFLEQNPSPPIRPVFEITEEQRQNSPIQRHVPPSSSFLLTTTGRTVVATAILILIVVALCMWWILNHMDSPAPPAPPEPPPHSYTPPAPAPTPDPIPAPPSPFPGPSPGYSTNTPPTETHRGP